jgi:Gpi18-like mannosyltransferase
MEKVKKSYKSALKTVKGMRLDLHDDNSKKVAIFIVFITLFVLAVLVRRSLIDAVNGDYFIFASWYDYVKLHGITSFNTDFSNYNPPYTYFLYLITLLPVSKIVAIKGLMLVFDMLLAFSVYLVVKQVRPGRYLPILASVATLFLPSVIFTGVFWGQFDQFYTAFILFSLYYVLKDNSKLAWLYFGIAIAIKLQAIFFLPVLIILMFKRLKWWHAIYGILAFVVLTFLPILAGRSFSSIVNIYAAQASLFKGSLTLNAPNIYQWVPNSAFDYLNNAGIYLTAAVMACFLIYALLYKKFSNKDVIILTAIMLFLVPFILPQMHERYFFPATIGIFIAAIYAPKLLWVAVAMQITTLFSYIPFLFDKQPPVSFPILAIIGVFMIAAMVYVYVQPETKTRFDRIKSALKMVS